MCIDNNNDYIPQQHNHYITHCSQSMMEVDHDDQTIAGCLGQKVIHTLHNQSSTVLW